MVLRSDSGLFRMNGIVVKHCIGSERYDFTGPVIFSPQFNYYVVNCTVYLSVPALNNVGMHLFPTV